MKKVVISALIALSSVAMIVPEADAKRVGGGSSMGRQSSNVGQSAPAQRSAAPPAAAAPAAGGAATAAAAKPASPWRGMLGGALLGLGLGALMSQMGLGGALGGMLGSILMIALLGVAGLFIYRMFKRKNAGPVAASATASAGYGNQSGSTQFDNNASVAKTMTPEIGSGLQQQPSQGYGALNSVAPAVAGNSGTWSLPADFDVTAFTRSAKTYFIRLQAAWDKADLDDIREFTTTEMFAEFRLELQERGASANVTDVVKLDAEVLGVETVGNDYLASVQFTGLIKEDAAADAVAFTEVWNLSKPFNGQGGWVLAGIQQVSQAK